MAQVSEAFGPATPVGTAAVVVLTAKMQPLFELQDDALSGGDMDAVHDMRVASRRTREALSIFGDLYRVDDLDRTLRTVKTVTRSLGAVRDADVMLDHFAELASASESADERTALAYLMGWRQAEREHHLVRMRKRLAKLRLAERRSELARFMHGFRRSVDIVAPVGWLAEDTLMARLDAFTSHLPVALEESQIAEQHQMRIAGKHLRYAIETFRPCLDTKRYDALRQTVVDFQDALGEMRDRDVFLEFVEGVVAMSGANPAGVNAEGLDLVIADLRRERGELFTRFAALAAEYPPERLREDLAAALLPAPPRPEPPVEPEPEVVADAAVAGPDASGAAGTPTSSGPLVAPPSSRSSRWSGIFSLARIRPQPEPPKPETDAPPAPPAAPGDAEPE